MTIQAVLFDIGGPIDTEVTSERLIDEQIRAALGAAGRAVEDAEYYAADRWAVEVFAPNTYQAIIWRLCGHDLAMAQCVYAEVAAQAHARATFELRTEIADLLERLRAQGLRLVLQ